MLAIGFFVADCGNACTSASAGNPGFYYSCTASSCSVIAEALTQQVQNPVASFAQNNNGVVIELPAIAATTLALNGALVLGIGTGSDNGIGSAKIFSPDRFGNLLTTFSGHQYPSF